MTSLKNIWDKNQNLLEATKNWRGVTKSCLANTLRDDLFLGTEENQIKKPDIFSLLANNDINMGLSFYFKKYAKIRVKLYMKYFLFEAINKYGKIADKSCFWVYSIKELLIYINENLLRT